MGNCFTKEIICEICLGREIEPSYFTVKPIVIGQDDQIRHIMLQDYVRCDKYQNVLDDNLNKTRKTIKNYPKYNIFICSNGHQSIKRLW